MPRANARIRLVHHERRARHALDAAGDRRDPSRRRRSRGPPGDGVHARSAQAVDGRARDAVRQPGQQQRHPPDVAIVLPRLVRAAIDHVVQPLPVDAGVAVLQRRSGMAARSSVRTTDSAPPYRPNGVRTRRRDRRGRPSIIGRISYTFRRTRTLRCTPWLIRTLRAARHPGAVGVHLGAAGCRARRHSQDPQKPDVKSPEDVKAEETFTRNCVKCHPADRIDGSRRTRTQWEEVMTTMQTARGRGDRGRGLGRDPELPREAARPGQREPCGHRRPGRSARRHRRKRPIRWSKYRKEHGNFEDYDAFAKVPGLDLEKLEKKRDAISF